MFFISKKDVLYAFFIWGAVTVGFLTMVFPVFSDQSISNFIVLVLGLMIISWLIWIWFSTGYLIENNTLTMKGGLFKQTVHIKEIKEITKGKSVVTSAALAIDRLQIQYGNHKHVLVSPKNEYEFINLLLSKNPQIQIEDSLSKLYKIKDTAANERSS